MDKKMKSKMSKLQKGKPMIDTALIGKKNRSKIMKHRPLGIKKSIGRPKKVVDSLNNIDEKDVKPDIGFGIPLSSDSRMTRETVKQKRQNIKDKKDGHQTCKVCKRTYKFKSHLDRHMLTHTNHRSHKCSLCNAAFFDSHLLKRHLLSHTGKLPFECHLCKKRFYTKSEHARHLRIHDGEKPYQCKEEIKTRNPREIVIDDSETTLYSLNTDFDTTTQCVESAVQDEESKSRQLRSNVYDSPVLSIPDHAPKTTPRQPKTKKPAIVTAVTADDVKKFEPLVIKTDVDSLRQVDSLVIDCVIDDDSPKHIVNGGVEIIDCDSDDSVISNNRDSRLVAKRNTAMKVNKPSPGGNSDARNNSPSISNDSSARVHVSHPGASNATVNRISIMPKKQGQGGENNPESSKVLKIDHNVSFTRVQGSCEPRLLEQNNYASSNSEIYDCDDDTSYVPKTLNASHYDYNKNCNIRSNTNFNSRKISTRNQSETNNYESNIDNATRLSSNQNNSSMYDCNRLSTERNNNRNRDAMNRQSFYDSNNVEEIRMNCDESDSRLNQMTCHDVSSNEHLPKRKSSESHDECDMIGQYIGSKLRKLSNIMRVHAEKLINDVLYQAQLNALSKKSVVAENGIDSRKRSFQLDNLVELPRAYFNRD